MRAVNLILTDAYGIYIPQIFCRDHHLDQFGLSLTGWDVTTCLQGPETEGYWDAWESILNRAEYHDTEGNKYLLHQDGDLWLLCPSLMDAEELENFGYESEAEAA